jgi:hypothetical protein
MRKSVLLVVSLCALACGDDPIEFDPVPELEGDDGDDDPDNPAEPALGDDDDPDDDEEPDGDEAGDPRPADPFLAELDHVEFVGDGAVEVTAFDEANNVIGVVVLMFLPNGSVMIASEYDDGYGLVVTDVEGQVALEADLPDHVLATRAHAIGEILQPGAGPQPGWFKCGAMVMVTVASCWNPATAVWACGALSFLAACECLPELGDLLEIPHDEC